jgi:hypothetical protein
MTAVDRIARISASLETARAAATDGANLDLEGLAATVEAAMAEVLASPGANRAPVADALLALLRELERLSVLLARQQYADAQRRAAAAYGAKPARSDSET